MSVSHATPALEILGASKRYDKQLAVDGVSFSIEPGEVFGLLGPNGAGKSTLINLISGLTRLSGGRVLVFGHDNQSDFETTRRLTGVMPQEIVIDNFFTLEQSLRMHAGYYGYADDPVWRRTLVERLALEPYLKRKPLQLSGGTKRRHMLAKALIHKPRLLILDEPTAGVDVELRHNIWSFVREMRAMGTTVLLTTHYLEEAQEMCDRIAILAKGKIVALDRTSNLLRSIDDRKLLVRVSAPLMETLPALREIGAQVLEGGHLLSIPLSSDGLLGDLLVKLAALPTKIEEVESKSADLEEVFLSLTGARHV